MSNKTLLRETFLEAIKRTTPQDLIKKACKVEGDTLYLQGSEYNLKEYKNIYILGSGKAVVPMAEALEELLAAYSVETLLVGAYEYNTHKKHQRYIQSTHPLPSEMSIEAASALIELMEKMGEDDLYIYLLSGGTSALVELPNEGITLEEFQLTTQIMLRGGMAIDEINSVRKHLSQIKGGQLAHKSRAEGVVLVLSDVLEDDLHAIGSAPLYYDTTTFSESIKNLEKYNLCEQIPKNVYEFLLEAKQETPKEEHPKVKHFIIGSNKNVLDEVKKILDEKGVESSYIQKSVNGDVMAVAKELLSNVEKSHKSKHCYIAGGESTVVVKGKGKGGRNQHLALAFLTLLDGTQDITFLSAATDGIDGNSDAAGAIVDYHSKSLARTYKITPEHYLETFDSNMYFERTNELLISGATQNNLLDVVMILVEPNLKRGDNNG